MAIKPGIVWVEKKCGVRYFTEFRQIAKGKHRGMIEVTLPAQPTRRILVDPTAIRRYPVIEVTDETPTPPLPTISDH
jgi:hypothetical protein